MNSAKTNAIKLPAHSEAINHLMITGNLVFTRAVHVGSGQGDERSDSLVVRDGRGQPVIPGSSLRGALRSRLERMLGGLHEAELLPKEGPWGCGLYEADLPQGKHCIGNSVHLDSIQNYQDLNRREETEGSEVVWNELPAHLCDVCRLFGAGTFWASRLRFSDLRLQGDCQVKVRHGVGIHRDTLTAAPSVKYDQEVVEAGSTFLFEAIAENLDATDQRLLALALQPLLTSELSIGGSTTRGLGACKLEGGKLYQVNLKDKQQLLNYLIETEMEKRYPKPQTLDAFLKDQLQSWLGQK